MFLSLENKGQKSVPSPEAKVEVAVAGPMEIAMPRRGQFHEGHQQQCRLGQKNTQDSSALTRVGGGDPHTGQRMVSRPQTKGRVYQVSQFYI